MKILVCTDGSKDSQKALAEAAKIAGGCNADELAIIHVYDNTKVFLGEAASLSQVERFQELLEQQKEERKNILADALQFFEGKNISVSTIFEEGHPVEVINKVAAEGGFDMIVIGSRGLGGLKKLFLGSISSAVVQEASVSVLTVK